MPVETATRTSGARIPRRRPRAQAQAQVRVPGAKPRRQTGTRLLPQRLVPMVRRCSTCTGALVAKPAPSSARCRCDAGECCDWCACDSASHEGSRSQDNDISWGYYIDHLPESHCNAHPGNLVVLPPVRSLAPCVVCATPMADRGQV